MTKRRLIRFAAALLLIAALFAAGYLLTCYRADQTALAALRSDDAVTVRKTETGRLFDGPSDTDLLIFYPGGKVEAAAYAPLLHSLAAAGADVCLVEMPLRLAILDPGKAARVTERAAYENVWIGGHSLGGAAAAMYAAKHPEGLCGVILLAAYPTAPLGDSLRVLAVTGDADGVLNRQRYEDAKRFLPTDAAELVIKGGNHAQFGNYGAQKGDGAASVTAEEQQSETIEAILACMAA